ncbi:hypothetical protein CLIM01_13646 [Colletotrichum limetticola]|uniref:Uncharacterized protein n=1 Tax=Colletotrichum limetticola TaxID=1209924 RepID=A0ABQ9PCV6_9PEZI|nr:hypothetical protein CLIM01_13646 [Colletotrichum limetticola]
MDSPSVLLYRTALLKIQRPDSSILSTEGKELLYITPDGFVGGTGPMASYLMQEDMMDERAEITHYSAQPICNHVWEFQTKAGSFQLTFTSHWQEFVHLRSYISCEVFRYVATTSFPRTPGEVTVQMFPSGRKIGRASQMWFSHRDSPIICSVDIDIKENERIVVFKPQNQRLAPVISEALPIMTTVSNETATGPVTKSDDPDFKLSEGASWITLDDGYGRESMPRSTTIDDDSRKACTRADSRALHDNADSPAEATEQQYNRQHKSRTEQNLSEQGLRMSIVTSDRHPDIGHMEGSPCRGDAEDDLCIVARPWQ